MSADTDRIDPTTPDPLREAEEAEARRYAYGSALASAFDKVHRFSGLAVPVVAEDVWRDVASEFDAARAALPSAPDQRLREALRDFVALLPPDRWPLLRPETQATVDAALSEATPSPEPTLDVALAALRAAAEVLPGLDDRYDARYRSGYERFRHDIIEIAARLRGPA